MLSYGSPIRGLLGRRQQRCFLSLLIIFFFRQTIIWLAAWFVCQKEAFARSIVATAQWDRLLWWPHFCNLDSTVKAGGTVPQPCHGLVRGVCQATSSHLPANWEILCPVLPYANPQHFQHYNLLQYSVGVLIWLSEVRNTCALRPVIFRHVSRNIIFFFRRIFSNIGLEICTVIAV